MSTGTEEATVEAGRRSIPISHPDKRLLGDEGPSKLELARYYAEAAQWMEPYLRDRAIHVRSYPRGLDGPDFVQKSVPGHYPDWVPRRSLPKRGGGEITQITGPGAASLAYLAGQDAIEIHGWLSRYTRPDYPDRLVLDLDPTSEDFGEVREAAAIAREVFEELALPPYLSVTGSRGVHLTTPLDRGAGFDRARELARGIAERCASRAPNMLTVEVRKDKRRGRLFVDWLRNGYAQTAVVPYSVRARPGGPVAMPIEWSELAEVGPQEFPAGAALERLEEGADPWREMASRSHSVGPALERLRGLSDGAR